MKSWDPISISISISVFVLDLIMSLILLISIRTACIVSEINIRNSVLFDLVAMFGNIIITFECSNILLTHRKHHYYRYQIP